MLREGWLDTDAWEVELDNLKMKWSAVSNATMTSGDTTRPYGK